MRVLSVFGFGMLGLWEGIPAGFALRLPAVVVGVVSAAGSLTATLLVLLLGERVRARLIRPRPDGEPAQERMIDRVWRRYGVIGLGLLAPGLTGAPLGVALGLFLRAPVGKLLAWLFVGVVVWTVALTMVGMAGAAGVTRLFAK